MAQQHPGAAQRSVCLTLAEPDLCIDAAVVDGLSGTSAQAAPPHAGVNEPAKTMRNRIISLYRDTGGKLSGTARRPGVSRNTIYRMTRAAQADAGFPQCQYHNPER